MNGLAGTCVSEKTYRYLRNGVFFIIHVTSLALKNIAYVGVSSIQNMTR